MAGVYTVMLEGIFLLYSIVVTGVCYLLWRHNVTLRADIRLLEDSLVSEIETNEQRNNLVFLRDHKRRLREDERG